MDHVDVAVVGGGPAGASAGAAAASAGATTLVLEQGVPRADRSGLGPDSTDAAACLDYWIDLAGVRYEDIPRELILQKLDSATFFGPTEHITIQTTRRASSCPHFGVTFHRARFDDWLCRRAEAAGARYLVGNRVTTIDSMLNGRRPQHVLHLADGSQVAASAVVLADGPQRPVTIPTLDQFLPADLDATSYLSPATANHIGYQEYRRFPEAVFDPDTIAFWWGWIPGRTAYPWIFPDTAPIARVGLTMPIGMDLNTIEHRDEYRLLTPADEQIPRGETYVRRLLETLYGDRYDVETAFPVVESRGKRFGVEAYPISSTRPIDSPTAANIAVAGGAMGTTSPFHEGGYHLALRTGALAGTLAGTDRLAAYNDAWKTTLGAELGLNVAVAAIVDGYRPRDWDRAFRVGRSLGIGGHALRYRAFPSAAGLAGLGYLLRYAAKRWQYRNGRYVQLPESAYNIP